MMKKVISCISLMSLALIMAVPALAQEKKAAPAKKEAAAGTLNIPVTKMAIIDVQKILREAKAAVNLRGQLDKNRRKDRDSIAKTEDDLRDSQQELNRQRTVLSAEAFEQKRREWERKASALNRDIELRKQKLDVAFERSLGQIQKSLVNVVQKISADHGINLVLSKTQVLLVSGDMDITALALTEIDKVLPTVKLDLAAVAPKAKPKK